MFIYKCAAYVEQDSLVDNIFTTGVSVRHKFLRIILLIQIIFRFFFFLENISIYFKV